MSWSRGSELAEEIWDRISPHVDIEKLQLVAQTIIDKFEDHDADNWNYESDLYKTAYPFEENEFNSFVEEIDENEATLTDRGKRTVKAVIQAANISNASVLDLIYCFSEEYTKINDLDAYCLDILTGMEYSLRDYVLNNSPTQYPDNLEEEENELLCCAILLCAYGFGGAFEDGEDLEDEEFKRFLERRLTNVPSTN